MEEKHRIIDTPFGECLLTNEYTDNQGYYWCDLYIGDNFDNYVGTCACSMYDDDEVILEQIDELLSDVEPTKIVNHTFVTIYHYPTSDCSNHGLSSKHNMLVCFDGDLEDVKRYAEENGYDNHECLYVVRRMLWGEPHPYLTPLDWAIKKPNGNVCFGGNYAVGDSRWNDWFGHNLPLPIHDRVESWEDYEALTR